MKASFIISLIVIANALCLEAFGQNTSESTKNLLERARMSQRRATDSAIIFASAAMEQALSRNNHWATGRAHAILGRSKELNGNRVEGLINYFESLSFLEMADTTDFYTAYSISRNIASTYNGFGLHDLSVRFYDSATYYLKLHLKNYPKEAEKFSDFKKLNELDYYKYLNQYRLGVAEESINGFLTLIENEEISKRIRFNSTNRLSEILSGLGDKDGALFHLQSILDNPNADSVTKSYALQNIGSEYLLYSEFDNATIYYKRAIDLKEVIGSKESLFISYLDLGETLLKQENTTKAEKFFQKALSLKVEIEEYPERFIIHQFLGLALIDRDPSEAKTHLNRFTELSSEYRKKQQKIEQEFKRRELVARVDQYYQKKENAKVLDEKNQFYSRQTWLVVILIMSVLTIAIWLMKKSDRRKRKAFFRELQSTGTD